MNKSILVTGGAGFIGSTFVAQCVERGYSVVALDKLTYAGHESNLNWIRPSAAGGACKLVRGDIADLDLVANLLSNHRFSAVVNLAAESHVDHSIANPGAFLETNIIGAFSLLQASLIYYNALSGDEKNNFRFLQISTDEVYGSLEENGAFTELSPYRPNSPYAASKAAADHFARAWHQTYGVPVIVTHCTNNYGPRQHPEKLIPHMIHCALSGKAMPVYGDGSHVRDWIHVEDHAAGVLLALEKGLPGEVYHFGGDMEMKNIALVQTLCALLDRRRPKASGSYADQIAFVADRPGHDRRYAVNDRKAQAGLGFSRRYTFDKGLEMTLDWYLDNMAWCEMMSNRV